MEQRTCFYCNTLVEDEIHVLIHCKLYETERDLLFKKAISLKDDFISMNDTDKFIYLLSNAEVVKYSAKACHEILSKRRSTLYC